LPSPRSQRTSLCECETQSQGDDHAPLACVQLSPDCGPLTAKRFTAKKLTAKKLTAKKLTAKKLTAKKLTAKRVATVPLQLFHCQDVASPPVRSADVESMFWEVYRLAQGETIVFFFEETKK
jgi:hypothetical protein